MRNAVVGLLLALPIAAQGGVYKWVDADGNVQYGDRPAGAAQEIKTRPAPPPDSRAQDRLQRQRRLLDSIANDRQVKQEKAAKLDRDRVERERECQAARNRLERYERAQYLYDKGPNGEHNILSDEQRAAEEQKLREGIKRHCS